MGGAGVRRRGKGERMLLVLCSAAVTVTAALVVTLLPVRGRLGTWLAVLCVAMAQIVLLSEALSELRWISAPGYVTGHALLLAGAVAAWWRAGRPAVLSAGRVRHHELRRFVQTHRLLAALTGAVIALALLIAFLSWRVPNPLFDSTSYHLPRAWFWLDLGTARHFPTDNFRQVEFPPNGSFYFLWIMALDGYAPLFLPPWVAGLGLIAATAGLARLAGHGRAAAWWAGLLGALMPQYTKQLFDFQIDLPTAFTGACFVYFAWRALDAHADGLLPRRNRDLLYTGVAAGLFAGTKLTAGFLMPGVAVVFALYGFWRLGRAAWRPLLALGVSSLVGFALLGSYNYVLNWIDVGNPFSSRGLDETSDLYARDLDSEDDLRAEFFYPPANLGRYVFQTMDWWVFEDVPGYMYGEELHRRIYKAVDAALGLRVAAVPQFNWQEYGAPGFGPVGYVALLGSLPVCGWYVAAGRRERRRWAAVGLIAIAWSWLALFAVLTAWSPYKTRLFLVFMPLLTATTLPWLYRAQGKSWTWLVMVPVVAVSLLAGIKTVLSIWDLTDAATRDLVWSPDAPLSPPVRGESETQNIVYLRQALPDGAEVGVVGTQVGTFNLIRYLPDQHIVNVTHADAAEKLATGAVDYLLVQAEECTVPGHDFLPLVDSGHHLPTCLYPRNLADHILGSRYVTRPAAGVARLTAGIGAPIYGEYQGRVRRVVLLLPAALLAGEQARIEVAYRWAAELDADQAGPVTCGAVSLPVEVTPDMLAFTLDTRALEPLPEVVRCEIAVDVLFLEPQQAAIRPAP